MTYFCMALCRSSMNSGGGCERTSSVRLELNWRLWGVSPSSACASVGEISCKDCTGEGGARILHHNDISRKYSPHLSWLVGQWQEQYLERDITAWRMELCMNTSTDNKHKWGLKGLTSGVVKATNRSTVLGFSWTADVTCPMGWRVSLLWQ